MHRYRKFLLLVLPAALLALAAPAAGATLDQIEPQYLRRPDVTMSAAHKSVLG